MKLIKKIIEDAAGGACGGGTGAAAMMPLFSTFVRRTGPTVNTPVKVIKYGKSKKKKNRTDLGLSEAFRSLNENDPTMATPTFDNTEVIAKLKSLETKEKTDNRDSVTFGLEDDDGGIVRVTIRSEQAEEFEKALQSCMSEDEDEKKPEIAELLFKLKDRFDIVDVQWPEIEEDEEEGQQLADQPPAEGGEEGDLDIDPNAVDDGLGGADTDQVKDLLSQVIDMMKADADARKADARAREAEARGREAEAGVQQAMAKVKQEEQILDMETYNKSQKESDREAKRLAQLAKWKHDMATDQGIEDDPDIQIGGTQQNFNGGADEEEEFSRRPSRVTAQRPNKGSTISGRVHPHDIAQYILKRVK